MPKSTLVFAALLLALGVGAFSLSGSRTALLPAYVGGALAVPAVFALVYAGARRHLMHVAAVVALLGALAPTAALAIRAAQMSPLALGVNVGMLALCAALLTMMIRSFVVARRSGREPLGAGLLAYQADQDRDAGQQGGRGQD
jgi:hypothetical protein